MVELGNINRLRVVKSVDFGFYLDGEQFGEILLPKRYAPEDLQINEWLEVFLYLDSEDRIIATSEIPLATVGQCGYLKVIEVNEVGAFLDWGLPKDLLVPFSNQINPMEVGRSYTVYLYLDDKTQRIVASPKLNKFLDKAPINYYPNQAVQLLIWERTDLGTMAIINHRHTGLIFTDDQFKPIKAGDCMTGYIKNIRPDGKIDLSLQLQGQEARDHLATQILAYLEANGGLSSITDKSPPEVIYKQFSASKGNYKKALGKLYKERLITIEKDKITLVKQ
jgi:hypothetical protein